MAGTAVIGVLAVMIGILMMLVMMLKAVIDRVSRQKPLYNLKKFT